MRKLIVALLSSAALSVPFLSVSSALANQLDVDVSELTPQEAVIVSWRLYADYKAEDALEILNHFKKMPDLDATQAELIDLMRLMIYRQEGSRNTLLPGATRRAIAIEYLTEAIVMDDTNAHARRLRAASYCKDGNYNACKRDFEVAWELNDDKSPGMLADHLSRRGRAYQDVGRIKEGNADLREAIRLYRLEGEANIANIHENLIRPE